MYKECEECKTKQAPVKEFQSGQMVEWNEWKTKRVEKMQTDKHEAKTVIFTLKEKEKGTISNLVEEFHKEVITCCRHLFNINTNIALSIR